MKFPFGFSFEADFSGDGLLFVVLLILGSVFVFLMNKPSPYRSSRQDYLLSWIIPTIRIFALLMLLLLLFSPQLSLNREYSIPKRPAVIIDQSRSMGNAWQGSQEELLSSISQTIGALKENAEVDIWTMKGQEITSDNLSFTDESSAFGWIPPSPSGSETESIYSTVFLFSDGHLNGGRSPLDMTWSKTIEVNAVYPLRPNLNTSLKLIDVTYLSDESRDGDILILGKVQQEGLIGRRAILQVLTENDQLLTEEIIQLNQGFQDIKLSLSKTKVDVRLVKVKVFLEGGEYLEERFLEIVQNESKKNVLIVSERVNRLHKFLIQSFSDSTFHIHIVQGTHLDKDLAQSVTLPENLDLIVLNNPGDHVLETLIRTSMSSETFLTTPSVLFYDGEAKLHSQWIEWLGIDGVELSGASGPQTSYWSETSKDHAFFLGLLGQGFRQGDLMDYAPIDSPPNSIKTNGDPLIMIGRGASSVSVLGISDQPSQAIFSGSGFWKWFFHPQSQNSFELLWDYLLTYLEEIDSFHPVQIDIPVQIAVTGEYVRTNVTIKDFENRIIGAAELRVWQEDEMGNKTSLNLSRGEHGIYQTEIDTKFPGDVVVIAEAYRFGELWGRDTSRIQVMNFNGEDQSRGVDEIFLSRLAARSGGRVIQIGEDELPNIPVEMIERASSYQYGGVRSSVLFAILIGVLTLEWIWRRRGGLL